MATRTKRGDPAHFGVDLVLPEGIEAGLVGGFAVIAVVFLRDMGAVDPFHTPAVLGTLLLSGADAARELRLATGAAAFYNLVHFVVWIAGGCAAVATVRAAEGNPRLAALPVVAFGAWLLSLVALDALVRQTGIERGHLWLGGFAGGIACATYLMWRHPRDGEPGAADPEA